MDNYLIKPKSHKGIPYHKLTQMQHLEYLHSLDPDMRSYEYDKYRKTDYPQGMQVETPKGRGTIRSKNLFEYNVDLGKGNWHWFSEGGIKPVSK